MPIQLSYKKDVTLKTYCHSENDHLTANDIALTSRTRLKKAEEAGFLLLAFIHILIKRLISYNLMFQIS